MITQCIASARSLRLCTTVLQYHMLAVQSYLVYSAMCCSRHIALLQTEKSRLGVHTAKHQFGNTLGCLMMWILKYRRISTLYSSLEPMLIGRSSISHQYTLRALAPLIKNCEKHPVLVCSFLLFKVKTKCPAKWIYSANESDSMLYDSFNRPA